MKRKSLTSACVSSQRDLMNKRVGQEDVCAWGFPTNQTAVHVSDNNIGIGSPPTHAAEAGWNNPHPHRMLNQGQNSFLMCLAAGNVVELGSGGKNHW